MLDTSLSGHLLHCRACDRHLTSLLLCPDCGVRYDPDKAEAFVRFYAWRW